MRGCTVFLAWVGCVLLGAVGGYLAGYVLWQLGFELIGSAVAIVGAVVGATLAFVGFLVWRERRRAPDDSSL